MTRVSDPPERLASNLSQERWRSQVADANEAAMIQVCHLKDLENALQGAARSVLSRVQRRPARTRAGTRNQVVTVLELLLSIGTCRSSAIVASSGHIDAGSVALCC